MRIMTVDLEFDWETKSKESVGFIPKILDFFDDHDVKATFFVLGELAEKEEDIINEIAKKHEVASHSYNHIYFNKLSQKETEDQIGKSKELFKRYGVDVKGFRAPFFVLNKFLGNALKKHSFVYDSSIASYFPGGYNNWFVKKKPYKASAQNLKTKGDDLMEIPVPDFTIFRMPSAGFSYYRSFHPISKVFGKPYMIYVHPCEFIKKPLSKDINFFVRMMYKINSGEKAWKLFEEYVQKTPKWVSCIDYVK